LSALSAKRESDSPDGSCAGGDARAPETVGLVTLFLMKIFQAKSPTDIELARQLFRE